MKGRERPCSIKPQLRSSPNVLQRSVEPAPGVFVFATNRAEGEFHFRLTAAMS
jgi:hypothetical protein